MNWFIVVGVAIVADGVVVVVVVVGVVKFSPKPDQTKTRL